MGTAGTLTTIKGKRTTIHLENFSPVWDAKLSLGDFTIVVGPQASGKSVFLQTLKLAENRNHILGFFDQQNVVFDCDLRAFIDSCFGRGISGMLDRNPSVIWAGKKYEL